MTATGSSSSRFLVLNNKNIVHRLSEWFPEARSELVLACTPGAIAASGLADPDAYFRHVHRVQSFDDPSTEEELFELCRKFDVDRILSTGERQTLPAARLRQRLGLPGLDVATGTAFRDKLVMKSHVAAAGLPVAPMRGVDDAGELRDFVAEIGYPVIVKPRAQGGSAGIHVLGDAADLAAAIAGPNYPWREPMLAEAWINGDFYQFNGLMEDGAIVLGQASCKPYSDWFSVGFGAPYIVGMLPDTHPMADRLRVATAQILAALPTVPGVCAFHAELFHTPDDRLVLCEIACRAGGPPPLVQIHEAVFGVNLHGASLLGQAGRWAQTHYPALGPRQGFARFPPARSVLRHVPDHCPLPNVLTYTATGERGRRYDGSDSLGPIIAQMTFMLTEADVLAELREIERWWQQNTLWEKPDERLTEWRGVTEGAAVTCVGAQSHSLLARLLTAGTE